MKKSIIQEERQFKETHILFKSDQRSAINAAISTILIQRTELETYIIRNPQFQFALQSLAIEKDAPKIVKLMEQSTRPFDIGPMAAVAGVLADLAVSAMLKAGARTAIVENGGEISASSEETFSVGLITGEELLSNKMGFQIVPFECPIGIATSSATIGHAISFGEADAVTVFADTSGIADAAATTICNSVKGDSVELSVKNGLEYAKRLRKFIRGVMIIREKYVGSLGQIPRLIKVYETKGKNQHLA